MQKYLKTKQEKINNLPNEVFNYIYNNEPIPLEIYDKYKDKYNMKDNVLLKCKSCNNKSNVKWEILNKYANTDKEYLCSHCLTTISKLNHDGLIPTDICLKGRTKDDPLSFDEYLKYKDILGSRSRKYIHIKCKICGEDAIQQCCKIMRRKYAEKEEICQKCVLKFTTNQSTWKEKNSKAQLIAQNRPETIEKQKLAQRKHINDKNYIRKHILGTKNVITGNLDGVEFRGFYELIYLLANPTAKNCHNIKIDYVYNGEQHTYFPDFINDDIIIEVKYNYSNDYSKYKAKLEYANKYAKEHNMKYEVITSTKIDKYEKINDIKDLVEYFDWHPEHHLTLYSLPEVNKCNNISSLTELHNKYNFIDIKEGEELKSILNE